MQVGHGGIIIFVIDGPKVQISFQCAECIFYFPDGVINVPHNKLILYIQIGAQEINAEAFVFFLMLGLVWSFFQVISVARFVFASLLTVMI